jgi:DNA-binding beta-propeller fold protein YncE
MTRLRCLGLLAASLYLAAQSNPADRPGNQTDGAYLLPSGWRLRPAGTQMPLGSFPMSTALSPDGRFLLVLNAGTQQASVSVFDARSLRALSRVEVPDAWLGLTFTPNGKSVYVGGGSQAKVQEFAISEEGKITAGRSFSVARPDERTTSQDFVGDVTVSPDGRLLYAALVHRNQVAVINPLSGMVIEKFATGRRPYRILIPPNGKSVFVSSWADSMVYQHRPETGERMGMLSTGPHPTDMVWRPKRVLAGGEEEEWAGRIFVTAANTNNVYVLGVRDDGTVRMVETISVALTQRQPVGSTPSALALNPDLKTLYAICSDVNLAVAIDVTGTRGHVMGMIPTGRYPTAARVLADGRLFILNGQGVPANPALDAGSASIVEAPTEAMLSAHSYAVIRDSAYRDDLAEFPTGHSAIVPANGAVKSPIEHVIYVIKGSRSYRELTATAEDTVPNQRKLGRDFALLDNFYTMGNVAADGLNWSTAAIVPDYVQKLWPSTLAGRRKIEDFQGVDAAALPPAGYLWSNAIARGLSVRNYGLWVKNTEKPGVAGENQVQTTNDLSLRAVTNLRFRGEDANYTDIERMKALVQDVAEFERTEKMPRLLVVRLANEKNPADSDFALGMLVDSISHTRFWQKSVIFVVQSDAAGASGPVNSHHAPAWIISPYTRGVGTNSTMYTTASVLRTIEMILGMHPMTVFDATATPMAPVFLGAPVAGPYDAIRPKGL